MNVYDQMNQVCEAIRDSHEYKKMQKLYEVLQLNPVASEYIQNYIRFQMMLGDLSKAFSDTIKEAVE